jgi:hypothetical protein
MATNSTIQYIDRRQGKRILTLKNSAKVGAVAIVLFAAISVFSEFRKTKPGELGRLYEKRPAVAELEVAKPQVIVEEAPAVADQNVADPLTIEAMRREQILGVTGADPLDPRSDVQLSSAAGYITPDYRPATPLAVTGSDKGKARFKIEGGAGGVYTKVE